MPIIHAIILGLVQGLSEFLPISSSGHLTIIPQILGWHKMDPSLEKTFEVALHGGTLIGALVYLRKDVLQIISSLLKATRTKKLDAPAKLGLLLLVATIPGAALGAVLEDTISEHFGKPWLVATALITFAVVLFICDRLSGHRKKESFNLKDAVVTGASQALALQPGVSRSGITMSALRYLGYDRESAARLSFLMLLPIVGGAALYTGTKTALGDGIPHNLVLPMIVGVIVSAITGWIAVYGLLKLVRTKSFNGFVIYRIAAGLGIFVWILIK